MLNALWLRYILSIRFSFSELLKNLVFHDESNICFFIAFADFTFIFEVDVPALLQWSVIIVCLFTYLFAAIRGSKIESEYCLGWFHHVITCLVILQDLIDEIECLRRGKVFIRKRHCLRECIRVQRGEKVVEMVGMSSALRYVHWQSQGLTHVTTTAFD